MVVDLRPFLEAANEFADLARSSIRRYCDAGFDTKRKPDLSVVTTADLETEKILRAEIERRFPNHGIIGEEHGVARTESEFQWVLDPIDGTDEFVDRLPLFGTLIALLHKGIPVVGVIDHLALDMRIIAASGLGVKLNGRTISLANDLSAPDCRTLRVQSSKPRNYFRDHESFVHCLEALVHSFPKLRMIGSCFDHTAVITDAADAYVGFHMRLWDVAATQCIATELGLDFQILKTTQTESGDKIYSILFGKPAAVRLVRDKLNLTA